MIHTASYLQYNDPGELNNDGKSSVGVWHSIPGCTNGGKDPAHLKVHVGYAHGGAWEGASRGLQFTV